jgi:replicative DNA helicase
MEHDTELNPLEPGIDIELEQALLGSLILDNSKIALFGAFATAEDFYDPLHRAIAERILAKFEAGRPVTPLTLKAALRHFHDERLDVFRYLVDIASAAPALPNVADLGRILRELAMKRDAIEALIDARENIDRGGDVIAALDAVTGVAEREEDRLDQLRANHDAADFGAIVVAEMHKGKPEQFGVRTRIARLDALIGGLYPGKLYIAGGRPGMGKSILGTTFSVNAAAQGWQPHYYSLEMGGNELASRMICDLDYDYAIEQGLKPLEYTDIERRVAHGNPFPRMERALEMLRDFQIKVHDLDNATASQLGRMLRAHVHRSKKPVLAVVDHLTIIDAEPHRKGDVVRNVDRVTFITRLFKRMCKELGIPIVLLSQLNRELEGREDKRPIMADFRDSGSIEQDADVLIGVNRPEQYVWRERPPKNRPFEQHDAWQKKLTASEKLLQLGVLKQRGGRIGDVECFVDAGSSVIRDVNPKSEIAPAQGEFGNSVLSAEDWRALKDGF